MLARAEERLASRRPTLFVQALTDPLPPPGGEPFYYDAVVSALAIHHLSDDEKRDLYARVLDRLAPGGVFVNAEQVQGRTERLQRLYGETHLDTAHARGSSPAEIARAVGRMTHDRCATVETQVRWLDELGFADADCFYKSFRFAVFGGWKPVA